MHEPFEIYLDRVESVSPKFSLQTDSLDW